MLGEALRLRVDVPAAPGGYDMVCGPGVLPALPGLLAEIGAAHGRVGRALVLSDATVAPLHGGRVMALLGAAGWDALLWAMPDGEAHKTLETVSAAYSWLAGQRIERGDTIIALGGGVVGDLAGFVAATYLRGLRLVQVPTTLVAQVERDALLVAVEGLEPEPVLASLEGRHVAAGVAADRRVLDLDHLGAEVGELERRPRARAELLDRDDPDVGERQHQYERGIPSTCCPRYARTRLFETGATW